MTTWPEPPAVQSIGGEHGSAANRQASANPYYLALPQDLHDPQIRRMCCNLNPKFAYILSTRPNPDLDPDPDPDLFPPASPVLFLFAQVSSGAEGAGNSVPRPDPVSALASARCFHLHGSHPSSARTGQSSCGTRHLPSAIPDSEFGDPELGPLCMRDMLRNATFWGFFEILGSRFSTQVLNGNMVVAICLSALFSTTINATA